MLAKFCINALYDAYLYQKWNGRMFADAWHPAHGFTVVFFRLPLHSNQIHFVFITPILF